MVHRYEFEVTGDAPFVGELTYGPYYFCLWDMPPHMPGEKRLLCLRITGKELPTLFPTIPQDFISLASLFLRRRLILGPVTRLGDRPSRFHTGFKSSSDYVDIDVVCGETETIVGETNLGDLSKWLPLTENLEKAIYDKYILAARFYQRALEMIETATDMAYLNLVSAIETLSSDTDIGRIEIASFDRGLSDAIRKVNPPDLREEIEGRIINSIPFIKRKFVEFIKRHVDDSFWDYRRRPETHGRVEPDDLEGLLKNIYDQRSRTLHTGELFPEYIYLSTKLTDISHLDYNTAIKRIGRNYMEEIPGYSMTMDDRSWKAGEYIPYPHFFERLVNHVLKNYLKANQKAVTR